MTDTSPQPGNVIGGRYALEAQIGRGATGSVWRARHVRLGSPVAIKLLSLGGGGTGGQRHRDRFEREARLAASVRHRNVVSIMDYGRDSDDLAYIVMEFLEGGTLADRIEAGAGAGEVTATVLAALQGLIAAHDAGVVHRDIKPDNIALVVDATGTYPKLVDFGISRQLDGDRGPRSAVTTVPGLVFGTPGYMSPEQARGSASVDARTDIYSIGAVLYEGLSGTMPIDRPQLGELLAAIVRGDIVPLHTRCPELDPALCAVVMRALATDREARFQSATELYAALLSAAPAWVSPDALGTASHDHIPATTPTASGAHRRRNPPRPAPLGRGLVWWVAGLTTLVILAGAWLLTARHPQAVPAVPATPATPAKAPVDTGPASGTSPSPEASPARAATETGAPTETGAATETGDATSAPEPAEARASATDARPVDTATITSDQPPRAPAPARRRTPAPRTRPQREQPPSPPAASPITAPVRTAPSGIIDQLDY